jgi:heterodisulfide reductase subunit A2
VKKVTYVNKNVMVIGGGIAGIQTALDIADAGFGVILVERNPSIGGHMIQYAEVFPTLDCPQCIMTPKMVEVSQHPNIRLMTYSQVQKMTGEALNFEVEVLQKARKVDHTKCNGCGLCWQKCPEKIDSEYNSSMEKRTAIYMPFPQAIPAKPLIDTSHCRYMRFKNTKNDKSSQKKISECRICEKLCLVKAIDWEQQDRVISEKVGAIVVATGFDLMPKTNIEEYPEDPDVLNGIQFERLLSPSGPTMGIPRRPSDGKIPKEVVFISCCGSRDPEHGVPYCSRVCCMYLAKQALLYKHAVPDGHAYIMYIDIRSTGKGYEEFVQRVMKEGVLYIRGKVSRLFRDGERLRVLGADTLSANLLDIYADLVVLGMAIMPSDDTRELASLLGIAFNDQGFLNEMNTKFNPLESSKAGIFIAGTAQGPKDIPDSTAQGSGAAAKVLALFAHTESNNKLIRVS